MKMNHATGLGEPEPAGKMALFQPPSEEPSIKKLEKGEAKIPAPVKNMIPSSPEKIPEKMMRIRTTIDLTSEALLTLQGVQQEYRLRTGRVLPLWKAVSHVVAVFEREKKQKKA